MRIKKKDLKRREARMNNKEVFYRNILKKFHYIFLLQLKSYIHKQMSSCYVNYHIIIDPLPLIHHTLPIIGCWASDWLTLIFLL